MSAHRELGMSLKNIHEFLNTTYIGLGNTYKTDNPVVKAARKTLISIGRLRSCLDTQVHVEVYSGPPPEEPKIASIYYPGAVNTNKA